MAGATATAPAGKGNETPAAPEPKTVALRYLGPSTYLKDARTGRVFEAGGAEQKVPAEDAERYEALSGENFERVR